MDERAVVIAGVSKRFGELTALASIDLTISRGEIVALLGPNGAGKTTLISIVAGLLRATSGTVSVMGHDVVRDYRAARRAVGLVPQEVNFDPFFTVEESLRLQAGYFGVRLSEERLTEVLVATDLTHKRRAITRALSGGMRRRLLIGKALVHDPSVLFLDEPTAGVDVELRHALWRYVRTLRARGTTIVLTTHYLDEAEELADRVAVIDQGRLVAVDATRRLVATHGQKRVRLTLPRALGEVPADLAALGATLSDDGRALEVTGADGALRPLLAALAARDLTPVDVDTRAPRLEDVFVRLVNRGVSA